MTRWQQLPAVPLNWRAPITALLVLIMAAALVIFAAVATPVSAPAPVDFTTFGPPGARILQGRWSGIFSDPIIQAGPIELIFWGVASLLGPAGLTGAAGPTPWIVFAIVVGAIVSVLVALVAERVVRPLSPDWSPQLGVGVAAVTALTGLTTTAIVAGHPAELAIPLMWIVSAALARRGSAAAAAAVLAATTGWELWGLLGVPVLLLAPRIDVRTIVLSALSGIAVLAVLFLPFVILGPFRMFSFVWEIHTNSLAHLLFPDLRTFAWPLRLTQGALAVGSGAVVARLTRRQPNALWIVPLTVCAVRLATDPVLAAYYVVPGVLMILIGTAFAIAQRSAWVFAACLVLMNLTLDVPPSVVADGIFVCLVVVTVVLVIRQDRARSSAGREPHDVVGAAD
jgi:hypothetical protein